MSEDRIYREIDALAAHVRRRRIEAGEWPLIAAYSAGLTMGAAIEAGMLTEDEASQQIDELAERIRAAAGLTD